MPLTKFPTSLPPFVTTFCVCFLLSFLVISLKYYFGFTLPQLNDNPVQFHMPAVAKVVTVKYKLSITAFLHTVDGDCGEKSKKDFGDSAGVFVTTSPLFVLMKIRKLAFTASLHIRGVRLFHNVKILPQYEWVGMGKPEAKGRNNIVSCWLGADSQSNFSGHTSPQHHTPNPAFGYVAMESSISAVLNAFSKDEDEATWSPMDRALSGVITVLNAPSN
ncbi:hypothetical protein BC830DRAFT_1223281, partial [Chytriomyces sp. MP71]